MAASRKPAPAVAPKKPTPETEDLRFLKRSSCPTLSGKSTLYYDLVADAKGVLVRVTECSGGGFLSGEWVSLTDIRAALQKAKPFTAIVLFPLFHGKSVNTPGFLLAVLKAEKLIQTLPGKTRVHEMCSDWDARVAEILEEDTAKAPASKASPAKTASTKAKPAPVKARKPAKKKA